MALFTAPRIIAGVLVLGVLYFASAVFVPFVMAVIIALLLDPVVTELEKRKLSRSFATLVAMGIFALFIGIAGQAVYQVTARAMRHSPQYLDKVNVIISAVERRTGEFAGEFKPRGTHMSAVGSPQSVEVTKKVTTERTEATNGAGGGSQVESNSRVEDVQRVEVVDGPAYWRSVLLRTVGSVFEVVSIAFFVPLFVFYFLIDKSNLVESFNTLAGKFFYLPKLNSELPKMIRAFFRANIVGGLILVLLHLALFLSLGLKNALALAFVSGFLNLIPLVGGPLALFLPFAQGLVQWNDPLLFVVMTVGIVVFHFTVGNVVLPQMIGARINVNPAALILGLLFWGWLWGAIGFLVAIPLTATLRILLESNNAGMPLANLLAAKPRHVVPLSARTRQKLQDEKEARRAKVVP